MTRNKAAAVVGAHFTHQVLLRLLHNKTVGNEVDRSRARTWLAVPSAAPKRMLTRRAIPIGVLRWRLMACNCLRSGSVRTSLGAGGSGIRSVWARQSH